MKFAIILNTH